METQVTFGKVLSHVIGWTILGFVVLLLIGPVLAVLGTILPFALVGFLSWAGYRAARRLVHKAKAGELDSHIEALKAKLAAQQAARETARQKIDEQLQLVRERLSPGGTWNRAARGGFGRVLRWPGALVARVVPAVLRLPITVLLLPFLALRWFGRQAWGVASVVVTSVGRLVSWTFAQGRFATVIMLEVFCGIAVGGLLGGLAEQKMSLHGDFVLVGAAVGGLLGALVSLSTPEPRRKTSAVA
jgi:hypothetical protein